MFKSLAMLLKIVNWFALYKLGFSLCHVPFELFVSLSLSKLRHKALFVCTKFFAFMFFCTWVFYSTLLPSELIHIANLQLQNKSRLGDKICLSGLSHWHDCNLPVKK